MIRRFWPAGLTPTAIAVCTLTAVALAGIIVIAASMIVVATGAGATGSGGAAAQRMAGAAASGTVVPGGTLAQALDACSGELALLALTVAVVLGVAATERNFLPPRTRVTAQIAHRAVALTAFGFLVVHILLETVSARATPLAAVLPFTSASGRLYLGLGTIASDLVIAVIATSLARMRYSQSARPQVWRALHRSIYVAWPLAIVHGVLMRGVPVWAAWTYGICGATVALAIAARIRMQGPLPLTPTDALRELPPALPPGLAAPRRPSQVAFGPQAFSRPVRHPPVHHSPVHRPPVHRAPVHRAPMHRAPVRRQPASWDQPVPRSAPPWGPARHPTD